MMKAVIYELIGIVAASVSRLLADEIKAWLPVLTLYLVRWSVRKLPVALRNRLAEEWRADLDGIPGDISKFLVALGFVFASATIALDYSRAQNCRQTHRGSKIGKYSTAAIIVGIVVFAAPDEVAIFRIANYLPYSLGAYIAVSELPHAHRHTDNSDDNPLGPAIGKLGAGASFLVKPQTIGFIKPTNSRDASELLPVIIGF